MEVRIVSRHQWNCSVSPSAVGRITHSSSKDLHHLDESDRLYNAVRGQECDECLGRIRDTNTPLPTSYVIPPNLLTVDSDPFVQDSSPEGTKVRFFYSNAFVPLIANDIADVVPKGSHEESFEASKHLIPLWYNYLSA